MRSTTRSTTTALTLTALASACSAQGVGYTDTERLPGQQWRVHDAARPNPPVIDPGPAPERPAPTPSDAVVLMGEGAGLDEWQHGDGRDAEWIVESDGAVRVKPGTGDIQTRQGFGSCQLHVEWATPEEVVGESQGRGNSGVFLFGVYEVQILDSFENKTYADGQAASLYGQYPPDVNASRGPGEWQSFDIIFEAPEFDASGKLVKPAYATVLHNGVVVHHRRQLLGATAHRSLPKYTAHGASGPIKLQDHGNPTRFRNIWVRPLEDTGTRSEAESGSPQ